MPCTACLPSGRTISDTKNGLLFLPAGPHPPGHLHPHSPLVCLFGISLCPAGALPRCSPPWCYMPSWLSAAQAASPFCAHSLLHKLHVLVLCCTGCIPVSVFDSPAQRPHGGNVLQLLKLCGEDAPPPTQQHTRSTRPLPPLLTRGDPHFDPRQFSPSLTPCNPLPCPSLPLYVPPVRCNVAHHHRAGRLWVGAWV